MIGRDQPDPDRWKLKASLAKLAKDAKKILSHPDSLCDSMMDAISITLSQAYLREFGTILHHNIDKGLLSAGTVKKRLSEGRYPVC